MRISEALNLRFADITRDGLLIRETKFRKTRLVPLHDTAMAGLDRYLMQRRRVGFGNDPVFLDDHGGLLPYRAVQRTFLTLLGKLICGRHLAVAVPACTTFVIHSRCGRCRPVQ